MSIKNWPGGYIKPIPPTPAGPYQDGAASGVWTIDQASYWTKQGLWPTAGNINPDLFIENLFSTYLYTGNGSTQTITNGIDLAGKGGMVWTKSRNTTTNPTIVDTARGIASNSMLYTNTTAAAYNGSGGVTAFNSNGYTLGNDVSTGYFNTTDRTYASWTFRKAPKFFDVRTKSHTNGSASTVDLSSLGTVGMVVVKATSTTSNWYTWHRSLTAGNNLKLNLTDAQSTTNAYLSVSGTTLTIASTAPTATYVVYAFAHDDSDDGIIQCGSFTTDASGNATVNLGWEPQFVLAKPAVGSGGDWRLLDSMRGYSLSESSRIAPNTSGAELTGLANNYPTATGFYFAGMASVGYIYIAIRRGPMKTPTSGTQVFAQVARGSSGTGTSTGISFPPDMSIGGNISSSNWNHPVLDRLRGVQTSNASPNSLLYTNLTDVESTNVMPHTYWTNQTAYWGDGSNTGAYSYFFRRAPGFFDEVCYTGTGASRQLAHNLGVVPELVLFKRSNAVQDWDGGFEFTPTTYRRGYLNLTNALTQIGYNTLISSQPTNVSISLANNSGSNALNSTYVAYLFASCPGVSKVGSYTGNGSTQTINCGFTSGARFVLIKRTDSTGDWYVWDTARGIVAGNDPHLSLNTAAAEVTTDDTIDPDATGFIVNQVSATNVNVNAASYIYLAIA